MNCACLYGPADDGPRFWTKSLSIYATPARTDQGMAHGVAAATCSMTASWSAGMIAASGPADAPESGPGSRPRFAELVARPSNDFRSSRITKTTAASRAPETQCFRRQVEAD